MESTVTDPLIGRLIDGRYEVISRLARGGMARVYRAVDKRLDRHIALKVMHGHLAENEQFLSRFQREARSAARLNHPAVVAVYDQGRDGDVVYLAMELIEGQTVRQLLEQHPVLSIEEAFSVLEPLLDALGSAHGAGYIHRDVKPENILLSTDGNVKVADFGLARAVSDATATSTNTVMGTVAYLSPELLSRGIADARSDVYAAGILLYEMLTGTQPFVGETPIQVAYQHVHHDMATPSAHAPWLPTEVDQLIHYLTAKEPDARPVNGDQALTAAFQVYQSLPHAVKSHVPPKAAARSATQFAPSRNGIYNASDHDGTTSSQALPDDTVMLNASDTSLIPGSSPSSEDYGPPTRESPRNDSRSAEPASKQRQWFSSLYGRKGFWPILLGLFFVIAAGLWYFLIGPGAYKTLPNVLNASEASAQSLLQEGGFDTTVREVFDDDVDSGKVVSTQPAPRSSIARNATVTLIVSKGPEHFEIPDVIGMSEDEALAELKNSNLVASIDENTPWSEETEKGSVVSIDPEPGTDVTRKEEITITLSGGRKPIDVPVAINKTRDEAIAELEESGLKVEINEEYSESLAEGHVLSQDPESGTLHKGDTVTLTISKGPENIEVPNVLGHQVEEAQKELEEAGFSVKTRQMNDWWVWGNRVSDQSPRAGDQAKKGSEVVITLS